MPLILNIAHEQKRIAELPDTRLHARLLRITSREKLALFIEALEAAGKYDLAQEARQKLEA